MLRKRLISLAITAIFAVTAITVPAFAGNNGNGQQHGNFKFKDSEESSWATKSIEKMAALGIISGIGPNMFAPKQNLTNIQAVALVLKLTGYQEQAESIHQVHPKYKGDKLTWGAGYIFIAIEKGIITPDELATFKANEPAKRYEVAKYLIRAMGKNDEALAHMNETLTFADSDAVPDSAIGYVYLINELKIMLGNDNNEFQPMKPITRAEMAVLVDRANTILEGSDSSIGQNNTTIVSFNDAYTQVTVKLKDGTEKTYSVLPNAPVYADGKFTTIDTLKAGDAVELSFNNQEQVIFIELIKETTDAPQGINVNGSLMQYNGLPYQMQAKVDSLKLTQNYNAYQYANRIYLMAARGEMNTSGYSIRIREVTRATLSDGTYGITAVVETEDPDEDEATAQVITYPYSVFRFTSFDNISTINFVDKEGKSLAQTTVKALEEAVSITVTGTVYSVTEANNTVKVKYSDGTIHSYEIADNATIEVDGKTAQIADLSKDMPITLNISSNVVVSATAQSGISEVTGTLAAYNPFMIKVGSKYYTYAITDATVITLDGKTAAITQFALNSKIIIKLQNDNLIEISNK